MKHYERWQVRSKSLPTDIAMDQSAALAVAVNM